LCSLALACGCKSSSQNLPDGAQDAPAPALDAGNEWAGALDGPGLAVDGGTVCSLSGTVRDQAGVPVLGAKLQAGAASVFSDGQGHYALAVVDCGSLVLAVTRDWFQSAQLPVTTSAVGPTQLDITLTEMPLRLDPADLALAAAYTQPSLAPSPLPTIVGGVAASFTFPIHGGANDGKEALVLASVVDAIAATPVAALEKTDYMLWTPMLNWLTEWDPAKSADLKMVGVAVRQQSWGTTAQRPQELGRVYLDRVNHALWVEVVFATFVQLGEGITDADGDGFKEVFARIDSTYATQEILDMLVGYAETRYATHAMSKEVTKALREIYSTTSAQVLRYIGQPYDIVGLGTIQYPFVVLQHATGQVNVILVGP
jgi:hypothetical protein